MKNPLQGRPFTRPLFIWISGILLHLFFAYQLLAGIALAFSLLLIVCSLFSSDTFSYRGRKGWGMVFTGILLALSVLVTEYMERRQAVPVSPGYFKVVAAGRQQKLVAHFEELCLTDVEKSVLSTLTLGYRKEMPKETRKHFSLAGVSHILAVSGFHVAIVCMCLSLLLRFIPQAGMWRWITFILNLVLLWCFVFITGLAASAVRAALMLSLYLTGRVLNRVGDSYNTLAAAALIMLVYNPFFLFDIGFQLSYAAVGFILFLQPRLNRLINVRNPLLSLPWGWLTVTIAAQTGTTFLCLFYFGQFSTVFLFTNLPVTTIATLLIPAGLLWVLLPAGFPGSFLLQAVIENLLQLMLWVVERFGTLPGAAFTFRFGLGSLLGGYLLLILFLLYLGSKRL